MLHLPASFKHSIYYDSKLLVPVVYFFEPVKTSLWVVWAEQLALYIWYLPQIGQEGNECTTTYKKLRTFFCNRLNPFLCFGRPQLYNLEALPFIYYQYVVIMLADKLYNSVTVCFCVSLWIFIQINNFSKLLAPKIGPLTLGLQSQHSTSTQWRTH